MSAWERARGGLRGIREEGALPLLVAGTFFMQTLDGSVITPAIPAMAQAFRVRPVDLNIGVSAYMLTVAIFIPVSGWAAQRWGARRIFLLSILVFTLASLACGMSQSLPQFVAARVAQGLGGAMMVPVGRRVVLELTPKDRLMGVIALLTWPGLLAPVLGPPLGGVISDSANWRWIFWLNLPLGAIALTAALKLLPRLGRDPDLPFDWIGFGLIAPGLFCLLFAAEALGHGAVDWTREGALLAGAVILLGLGLRHLLRAAQPMLRFDALRHSSFRISVRGGSLFRLGINAVPFLLPLMFQVAFGWSALTAGLMLTAIFAGNIVMKPFTTPVLRRFGFRSVLVVNGVLNAAAIAAMVLVGPETPVGPVLALLFVSGLARSMQFTALTTLAFADVPQAEMGTANTLFSTLVQLSRGLGVALGAIGWRLGTGLFPEDPAAGFRLAFALVAAISLLAVIDSLRLARDAGDAVAHRGRHVRTRAS
ncbi:MFS transporter [Pseudooceanicola sp. CBS1P-1]|uniref:MFS transporter n=1 Tax=Pseudooceanicola albus TaxID=2692189 RepID=A0A6L7G5R2_9RHOB|nr:MULTISPECIES: MFS transporter [Pseudooceanicola]MBT9384217.1 MFS transporter [Pseudooceanicola endophyticus]MXN19684.1 MFS transporter [Pseudooceanicola albus]